MKLFYVSKIDRFAEYLGEDAAYSIRRNFYKLRGAPDLVLIDGEATDAKTAIERIAQKYIANEAMAAGLAARLLQMIEEKNPRLLGWVSKHNPATKRVFELLIGRKLRTNKECDAAVKEFLGEEVLTKLREEQEQKAKEREARRAEDNRKQIIFHLESMPAKWNIAGRQGTGTVGGMIRAAIEAGLTELQERKAGCAIRYRLAKGSHYFPLKNKQWAEYAKHLLTSN